METYELTDASPHPSQHSTMIPGERPEPSHQDPALHRRTVRKLDFILLPFLALLFLFNALDKSNIGNAESAHFTKHIGLRKDDLNTAVALFFAFFVVLQPLGAALGRRYGMVLWVPSCMLLWGVSTALHIWVHARWQLYVLRILIGCLEAGFYPVTVTYLSLFYTRFEFGRRLSLFYGQAAVGGALGGLLSFIVFSWFPDQHGGDDGEPQTKWQSWQVLFLLEGVLTMVVAVMGYLWLPHNPETAWFLTSVEQQYASQRVIWDRLTQSESATLSPGDQEEERHEYDEESRGLLSPSRPVHPTGLTVTNDRGLTAHDVVYAFLSPKIWHLLVVNILSAVPVYAFQVFLPLVLAPLTQTPNPALVNLLTAPPYVCGAITLYFFASYSDRHRKRIMPILAGLGLVLIGLVLVVSLPTSKGWAVPRYLSLNILLSGTFIASPLTVAWISGNTPSPGKRAILLGINGWGNLAGVISAFLFQPKYAESGYIVPFWWTLAGVFVSAAGYVLFWRRLKAENDRRSRLLKSWNAGDVERERTQGRGPMRNGHDWLLVIVNGMRRLKHFKRTADWLGEAVEGGRQGDERITFIYGL